MKKTTTNRQRIDIQQRDMNILEAIWSMRYATVEQVAALFASNKLPKVINPEGTYRGGIEAIAKRLTKLTQYEYLQKIGWPILRPTEPAVFTLGEKSIDLFKNDDDNNIEEIKTQVRHIKKYLGSNRHNKHFHLQHRLGINDFRIVLALALRKSKKVGWVLDENGSPYWTEPTLGKTNDHSNAIEVKIRTEDMPAKVKSYIRPMSSEITVRRAPDAMFLLQVNGHKIGFLYEKDRGSEKIDVVAAKLYCYHRWYKKGLHKKTFGTNHLRVLIETHSQQHMDNLIEKAALPIKSTFGNNQGSGIFWFTTENNIDLKNPDKILEPIWRVGQVKHLLQNHSLTETID